MHSPFLAVHEVGWVPRRDYAQCAGCDAPSEYLHVAQDLLMPVCGPCACRTVHPGSPPPPIDGEALLCPACTVRWPDPS